MRILTRAFEILWSMSFGIRPTTQPNEFKHVESCNLAVTVHHDPIDYWHKCARTPTYNYIPNKFIEFRNKLDIDMYQNQKPIFKINHKFKSHPKRVILLLSYQNQRRILSICNKYMRNGPRKPIK